MLEIPSATVFRDSLTAVVAIGGTVQLLAASPGSQVSDPQTPARNQSANATATTPSGDPATVTFATGAGMVLHAIKPASVPDYEAVILALQDAFSTSSDAEVKRVAAGWRVMKAAEPDAKTNVIYVHLLYPTAADADYRPSLWLDQLLSGAPAELLAKYRDAFAAAPTMLSLSELAHMSVAPVTPAKPRPEKPGNSSPR